MAPGRLWDADVPLPDEISVVAGFDLSSRAAGVQLTGSSPANKGEVGDCPPSRSISSNNGAAHSPILDLATPFMMTDDSPASRAVRARRVLQAFGGVLRGPRMNQRGGRAAEEHVRPVMR